MIGPKMHAWLTELLRDCEVRSLNDWEDKFTSDIRDRLLRYGTELHLTDKQVKSLEKIEAKIHAR